ncbi:hypothetical protein BC835DRAFT_1265508 [Cytidiella melzeri]|nr:hypothetical protein BC835DRAFT_1265508 [Cytidiella melzeri]
MASTPYRNALNRVLEISEILELIFSFLDKDSHINTVVVCKKWSEIAMNIIWREVDDPRRLLSLLSPLDITFSFDANAQDGELATRNWWVFCNTPSVDRWGQFTRYARRVRSLSLDERNKSDAISSSVFDEMSRSRTTLNVLPNLRDLTWLTDTADRLRLSVLFQHEGISHFTVYLHKTLSVPLSTFCQEVLLRMPKLTHLDLRFRFPAREVEDDLVALLDGLKLLKRVVFPVYTITSRILAQLSTLQHLDTIQFEFIESQGHGDLADVEGNWNPQLKEGSFPALWDLSLSAKIPAITKFINSDFAPAQLQSLYIQSLSATPAETLSYFLEVLSTRCKLLTHLYMDFFTSSSILPTPSEWPRLTWETLRPVLSFPRLVSLEVRWDRPLDLTLSDIEEMASKWPSLQILLLNCEPMDMTIPPNLDLRALLPFAHHCPQLVELGLYMTASEDVPVPQLNDNVKPFQALQKLCVGESRISDEKHVALFLSQICPPGCEVTYGVSWPDGYGVVETPDNFEALEGMQDVARTCFTKWTEVSTMLPLLTKLRLDERAARESLEKEAEDLRIRCRLLSERANVKVDPDGSCIPF